MIILGGAVAGFGRRTGNAIGGGGERYIIKIVIVLVSITLI